MAMDSSLLDRANPNSSCKLYQRALIALSLSCECFTGNRLPATPSSQTHSSVTASEPRQWSGPRNDMGFKGLGAFPL
jgi:hypothetical protein